MKLFIVLCLLAIVGVLAAKQKPKSTKMPTIEKTASPSDQPTPKVNYYYGEYEHEFFPPELCVDMFGSRYCVELKQKDG